MVKYEGELEVMSISMIGIDHNMAPVDIRAKFACCVWDNRLLFKLIKNHCVIVLTTIACIGDDMFKEI